jgi:hypothetical protein
MTQDEIDKAWSQSAASFAVVTLAANNLIRPEDQARILAIVAEELLVRLIAGDRPDSSNWKYAETRPLPKSS